MTEDWNDTVFRDPMYINMFIIYDFHINIYTDMEVKVPGLKARC